MINRLLENWLNKASERSYQLPFCYLLLNRGETVIHLTRHCGMEHGKDIITRDSEGNYRAYQLKGVNGGRLSQKQWQDTVQQQVHSLIHTPIIHPSVDIAKGHRSFLVINGGLEEEVQAAITAINHKCDLTGKPQDKIHVILKGDMLDMLRNIKEDFLPSEVDDFAKLLDFYQQDGRSFLKKADFYTLLNAVLSTDQQNLAKFSRAVSSCSVLCSLALSSYTLAENHFAIVEGWTLFITSILRYAEMQGRKIADVKREIDLAERIISTTLTNLWLEVKDVPLLIEKTGPGDVPTYPYQLTIILGLLAYLSVRTPNTIETDINQQEIELFISRHIQYSQVWGESALPFILSIYWFLKSRDPRVAAELLSLTLMRWGNRDGLGSNFFAEVYLSADEAVALQQDWQMDAAALQDHTTIEYTLETVVHLCARNGLKELLIQWWPHISEQLYRDFEFTELPDYYLWRSRQGNDVTRIERTGHKWKDLVEQANQVREQLIPPLLKERAYFIPLFLMVYPHRVRRNIVIWHDKNI
ncbi:MAG: hypothetical protein P0Y53_12760 [Candidatus Pseudobacter hemicellulosilyticus]|uniref:Uncharacterized protein n=1 Tax=Candidatus Pseudobacter hemicellulosilyticus TaxID=3121375 RepID=A0AAJ5X1F9_9BACT|nr:MAG: hypothetical protein P0Y53_12760 [Pseudobacter sp.]